VWWEGGLRFTCLSCGRCCRGAPGAIYFTDAEGAEIASFLSLSDAEFGRRYVTLRWEAPSIRERQNGECLMYDASTARCAIYPVRPAQCCLFPFWPSLLESREEWDAAARSCPGMNSGELHTAVEISSLLRINPFPDLL